MKNEDCYKHIADGFGVYDGTPNAEFFSGVGRGVGVNDAKYGTCAAAGGEVL